jgi:hypothetical protein
MLGLEQTHSHDMGSALFKPNTPGINPSRGIRSNPITSPGYPKPFMWNTSIQSTNKKSESISSGRGKRRFRPKILS